MRDRDTDAQVLKRIGEGDTSAFRIVVEKYKDTSFSLACSILKNPEDAEDALQEAFIKVYRNARQFRVDSLFSTWLYRIVVNTCLNAKEKNKSYVQEEVLKSKESGLKSGLDALIEEERRVYVLRALEIMKRDESLLLRLYYLCDLKVVEIVEITGFSESNIKVILHRARKNLSQLLEKLTGNDKRSLL
ncbi:MAG: sigma-70 family RNA polymerase sigma factor [Cyclobacteriaceae bacterium]|nr:sigma-70 family RNA polymerase sigma factor [Cyclobacteriaceae bacterium]